MSGKSLIENGWFMEKNSQWPGQAFSLEVEEILVSKKSLYQDVLVFKSKNHGNVLVLDGVIQATEFDEFTYQEMLVFLALNSHPNPSKVLIIGGGDGGIAREVAKHPKVLSITQCEIDEVVVDVCKEHLKSMACSFDHPKMNLFIGDGFEYMKNHKNEFDIIISDISDPVGPAERLFSVEFYQLVHSALKEDGILSAQGESMFIHMELIKNLMEFCNNLFEKASYASTYVPTYPCGQIGFLLASKNKNTDFENPLTVFTEEEKESMKLRYYDEHLHKNAFVLPRFVKKELEKSKRLHLLSMTNK
ncbi:spermidine synthase isoform X2 [Hydra vulgaris]|uniref:Spermidine synthase isoform X2 n=1 Tax=Hydra vulgaris TaxID=6087 RepID=A0ABM4C100_HYDVU